MQTLFSQYWHLAWMLPAVFLIVYLGSPRHLGRRAFRRVGRLLRHSLDNRQYSQFHDLVLPTGGGSEILDHLLVSRFGIFVIISEYRPGSLSGGDAQELWKQTHLGQSRQFPNPVHRARLQMEALQRLLDYPRKCFQLLVVIDGQPRLPKDLPKEVVTVGGLIPRIRSTTQQVLTPEQADKAARGILESRLPKPGNNRKSLAFQLALGIAVVAGIYLVYGNELKSFAGNFNERIEQLAAPERFDETGARKPEEEIFEESLICAFSQDSMRCSCYQEGGKKVEVELSKCRELAERGSILKQ